MGALTPIPLTPTSYYIFDNFACNGLLSNTSAQCGTVNPPLVNGIYDLNTWINFSLTDYADITIKANQPGPYDCSDVFIRLFADSITGNCTDVSLNNLKASANNVLKFNCLPAGPYSIQLLGTSQIPSNVWDNCASNLGRPLEVQFIITSTPSTQYGLQAAGRVDSINTMLPLTHNITYQSNVDYFSCDSTVWPISAKPTCSPNVTQTIYRTLTIGDGISGNNIPEAGLLTITNLNLVNYSASPIQASGIKYQLLGGNANTQAVNNNTFTYTSPITGLTDYFGCITNPLMFGATAAQFCLTAGEYTFAAIGDKSTVGQADRVRLNFKEVVTQHSSATTAQNLGALNLFDKIYSDFDVFSCLDNAVIIDGAPPCNNFTKAIYREFYLTDVSIVLLRELQNNGTMLKLFAGQVSVVGIAGLTEVVTPNDNYDCTSNNGSQNLCDELQPGWYTLVAYGYGPNYTHSTADNLSGGLVGDSNKVYIESIIDSTAKFNRPYKACDAGVLDWGPNAGTVDYPLNARQYFLCKEIFTCKTDLPFSSHPINACSVADNRVAYYVFSITKPSFVVIDQFGGRNTMVFPFDVRTDSSRMITDPPVQPCISPSGYLQLCNLQPGTYTFVMFDNGSVIRAQVTPRLRVDSVGISNFDRAKEAYDFGTLTPDSNWYSGQGHLASIPGKAPSNDFFFCSTGASVTDPSPFICSGTNWGANPRVYPFTTDYHLFQTGDFLRQSRRNLWYTFVIDKGGMVEVHVDDVYQNHLLEHPFAVYKSNVDGSIPFSQLVSNGGIDSTLGLLYLTLVADNEEPLPQNRCAYPTTVSFYNCNVPTPVRYYVLVENMTIYASTPNNQIEVAVLFDSLFVAYDYCVDANVINGLNEVQAPYTRVPLTFNTYFGDPSNFNCATVEIDDNTLGACSGVPYEKTLWYKFEVGVSGRIKLALEVDGIADKIFRYNEIVLLQDLDTSILACNNIGLQNIPLDSIAIGTDTWGESCITPGVYYLLLSNCSEYADLGINPVVWIDHDEGDYCDYPIVANINGAGAATVVATINCHTMTPDWGEDGSDISCLDIPTNYKSTWFRADVIGPDRYNLQFSLTGTVMLFPVLYRVLSGSCGNMSVDLSSCSSIGNSFILDCLEEGSYYVQVFSPMGAEGDLELTVTSILNPNLNCSPVKPAFTWTANCSNDSVYFNNTSSGFRLTYDWTFGPSGQTSTEAYPTVVFPRADTIVSYTVSLLATDTLNHVDSTLTKTVYIYPVIANLLGADTTMCEGDTLILMPYAGTTFIWQDNTIAESYTVTTTGTYFAQDSTGCADTITVTFLNSNPDTVTLSICIGDSVFLSGSMQTTAGIYTDTFLLTNGCDSISFTNLQIDTLPIVAIQALQDSFCLGNQTTLSVTGNGSYLWNNLDTTRSITVSPTQSSSYSVQVTLGACELTDSITLTVSMPPVVTISASSMACVGDTVYLTATSNKPVTYRWNTAGTDSVVYTAIAGMYTVTATDAFGCTSADTFNLSNYPQVSVSLNATNPTCYNIVNGSIISTVTGGLQPFTYQWSNMRQTAQISNLAGGSYSLTVTDANGCMDTAQATIQSPDSILVSSLLVTDVSCFGYDDGIIEIVASGGNQVLEYSINGGVDFYSSNSFNNLLAGSYAVLVRDSNGCLSAAYGPLTITEPSPIAVYILPDNISVNFADSVEFTTQASTNATPPFSYYWDPSQFLDCDDCANPLAIPIETTWFVVELTDSFGCVATDSAYVYVDENSYVLYIPNAFTPNNDGKNDMFRVYANGVKDIEFIVFDRWGEKIFASSSIYQGWDGSFKGKLLNPGVYVFYVNVTFLDNHKMVKKGSVTLIR